MSDDKFVANSFISFGIICISYICCARYGLTNFESLIFGIGLGAIYLGSVTAIFGIKEE